jgi:hypothetical protein
VHGRLTGTGSQCELPQFDKLVIRKETAVAPCWLWERLERNDSGLWIAPAGNQGELATTRPHINNAAAWHRAEEAFVLYGSDDRMDPQRAPVGRDTQHSLELDRPPQHGDPIVARAPLWG